MKARIPQGGAPNNMQGMLRQAQKMQERMQEAQDELDRTEYSVSAGGGVIEVVVNGKHELTSINLKPEVVDPEDVEILQDLIISAVNEAMRKADADSEEKMNKLTGGINIPGLL